MADIGTRTFELRGEGEGKVILTIEAPDYVPEEPEMGLSYWKCVYRIDWPDRSRQRHAAGEDSMQALQLAMQVAAVDLYFSEEYEAGDLTWLGRYDLGLPVTEAAADEVRKRIDSLHKDGDLPSFHPEGATLRRLRQAADVSIEEMGRRLGIGALAVSELERGDRRVAPHILLAARYLAANPDNLGAAAPSFNGDSHGASGWDED